MKVRNGFVSNSSSSSFILAVRKGHEVDEIAKGEGSLAQELLYPVISFLKGRNLHDTEMEALRESFWGEPDAEDLARFQSRLRDLLDDQLDWTDWQFHYGSASDDDVYWPNGIGELLLCYAEIEHNRGNVRLWTQGGY